MPRGHHLHRVPLSNGRVVVLEEETEPASLHIGVAGNLDIEAWICSFETSGVLVTPNSGDGLPWLLEHLGTATPDSTLRLNLQRAVIEAARSKLSLGDILTTVREAFSQVLDAQTKEGGQ